MAVVTLKKSGISALVGSADRAACDELRTFLKTQCPRVGPVFEPESRVFAFYVYRRLDFVCELIIKHGGFTVETSDCPLDREFAGRSIGNGVSQI